MMVSVENTKESTDTRTRRKVGKVFGYKVNIQKLIAFVYTINKNFENEMSKI